MANVYSANSSSVLVDGEAVDSLQSLAFRIVTEREDIRAVGTHERVDVSFGLRTVEGEIKVRSVSPTLDTHLSDRTVFQLVANLRKGTGAQTGQERALSFDDCFIEGKSFAMEAGGTAVTIYNFSATRVREE